MIIIIMTPTTTHAHAHTQIYKLKKSKISKNPNPNNQKNQKNKDFNLKKLREIWKIKFQNVNFQNFNIKISKILSFNVREIRALSHRYHVGDDSQHSSATMLRVCLFRYQAVRSPPVSVFTTLLPQSRSGEQRASCSHCVSRVACRLRARVVVAPPRQGGGTSERQLVLCWSVCCGASYTVCEMCCRYILYCVLLHPSSTSSRLVALSILRETSHHSWLTTR